MSSPPGDPADPDSPPQWTPKVALVYDITQRLLQERHPLISVHCILEKEFTDEVGEKLQRNSKASAIGIAGAYNEKGQMRMLAIATASLVLLIRPPHPDKLAAGMNPESPSGQGRQKLCNFILTNPVYTKYASNAHHVAIGLYNDFCLPISELVDLQCMVKENRRRSMLLTAQEALQHIKIFEENFADAFRDELWELKRRDSLVQQAWLCQRIGSAPEVELSLSVVPKIDLCAFSEAELDFISKAFTDAVQLEAMKPLTTTREISDKIQHDEATSMLSFEPKRFTERVRQDPVRPRIDRRLVSLSFVITCTQGQTVFITVNNQYSVPVRTGKSKGKAAQVEVEGVFEGKTISEVTIVGRDGMTRAELHRSVTILHALQKRGPIFANPWVRSLWAPSLADTESPPSSPQIETNNARANGVHQATKPPAFTPLPSPEVDFDRDLNDSQRNAVEEMLSHATPHDITLVRGPPGTGKTSVIAAVVSSLLRGSNRTVWLVAKSNVAVKNIAEKLADCGIKNWKLVVSSDFFVGWHEHLYNPAMRKNTIIATGAPPKLSYKELSSTRVVLCTLSTLSNISLVSRFTQFARLEMMIVDEASQIEVGDYIPVFGAHGKSLKKICFIGDDRQLPPYGQDSVQELWSVFELKHLKEKALFLNTQYRMPPPIGDFISSEVYDGDLKSNPLHPVHEKESCQFFDVPDGEEEEGGEGKSFVNHEEIKAVLQICKYLVSVDKRYRVITPYDLQRSSIETALKQSSLPWEDSCFNVDSFQGNEDDNIIISIVRSSRVGFLKDLRRTNVMLSRCKKSMFICSSKSFLSSIAKDTLVGKMAKFWGPSGWISREQLNAGKFLY